MLLSLTAFLNLSLLLLRILIGLLFGTSGWSHVTQPIERAKSLEMSPNLVILLGIIELLGAIMVVLGVYIQIGTVLLIGVMVGAIYKKLFVWKTGFWGQKTTGWYYDLLYLVCNLVILTANGGEYVLWGG